MWIQYNHKSAHLKKRKAEESMPVMQKERDSIHQAAFEDAKGLHIQEMWEAFKSGEKQRKARNTALSTP